MSAVLPPANAPTLQRRTLLAGGASASLMLGFALPLLAKRAEAVVSNSFAPSAWLRITPDNRVTVLCGMAEMGQGVLTSIPMMVAEELDADWSLVSVEQAPTDAAFKNPLFGIQATGGSTTVRAHWTPLRQAGAAARAMLVAAAAQTWKLDAATLRTARSQVIAPDGRKLSYGALVALAATLPVPEKPALKAAKDFKILGQPTRRLDSAAKIKGEAKFGIDAHVDGMLVAVMARAPLPGAKLKSMDEAKARAVKGVHQVIALPQGVAVLADGYWAASQGRAALDVQWDLGEQAGLSSAKISALLSEAAKTAPALAKERGQPAEAAAPGAKTLSAVYEAPHLAHACMEPLNCTAWVREGEATLWVGTQSQGVAQATLSGLTQLAPEQITIHNMLLGGGFGRRFVGDFTRDATQLSMLSGRPVKLIYSREDDMAAGFYRPAAQAHFEASLDDAGRPTQLSAKLSSASILAAMGQSLPASGVDSLAVEGIADLPYAIPNLRVAYGRSEPGLPVWFWRSVGHSQNAFFLESFIDELAAKAQADPLQYRLALLAEQPRHRGVLEAAAKAAGWGKPLPRGHFHGIAVAESFGSYVAEVVEASVAADGTPKVHKVTAAVDCGMTVNPLTIRRQIEGAIVYGLSAALYGKITLKDGRVEQSNFHDYPVLRMADMPEVEVQILASSAEPGGIGEPGLPPLAPALANAIFAATGKRLRSLPIDTDVLKQA